MSEVLDINYAILLNVILVTLTIFIFFFRFFKNLAQKTLYIAFVFFFFIYNGFGMSYEKGVADQYHIYYIVFLITFSFSYLFFLKLFFKEFRYAFLGSIKTIRKFGRDKYLSSFIIFIFIFFQLLQLIIPEFKLHLLLNPPAPDILAEFLGRLNSPSPSGKLIGNVSFLLYPFYLLTLYKFRKNIPFFLFIVFFPFYIQYCKNSYLSRGEMMAAAAIIISIQWFYNTWIRKYLAILLLFLLPILPVLLWQYQTYRGGGGGVSEISATDAGYGLLFIETSFPVYSKKVIDSEKHIDLKKYFIWVFTLPVPKAIFGKIEAPSAGMEMSEILLNKKQGDKGFFALLAGLLTESIYMYGKTFYFIHAIFIACIFAIIARLTERDPILFCILIVMTIHLSYRLNRTGLGPVLSTIINLFLTFYFIIILGYLRKRFKLI